MNHFIVAPGEMMLVSDAHGGVTRYSGTSFAAPLVSGTVALIQDRWPWLAKYPKETIDIILQTATDLGAPGVDPVYGVGQLNVTGALSPISYDKLSWYQMDGKGSTKAMTSAAVRSAGGTSLAKWEASGMYFTAFETIGATYRDFLIPLSSQLIDKSALSAGGSQEQFQAYLYNQVTDWMKSGSRLRSGPSFNFAATSASFGNAGGLNVTLSMAPRMWRAGLRDAQPLFQSSLRLADKDNRLALTIGEGDGAIELGNSPRFRPHGGLRSLARRREPAARHGVGRRLYQARLCPERPLHRLGRRDRAGHALRPAPVPVRQPRAAAPAAMRPAPRASRCATRPPPASS